MISEKFNNKSIEIGEINKVNERAQILNNTSVPKNP